MKVGIRSHGWGMAMFRVVEVGKVLGGDKGGLKSVYDGVWPR